MYREGNAAEAESYNSLHGPSNAASQTFRVNGWHGEDMGFNASYADGHAAPMKHLVRTNVTDIGSNGYNLTYSDEYQIRGSRIERVVMPNSTPVQWADYLLYVRGDGWQLDYFPQPMVIVLNDQGDANL